MGPDEWEGIGGDGGLIGEVGWPVGVMVGDFHGEGHILDSGEFLEADVCTQTCDVPLEPRSLRDEIEVLDRIARVRRGILQEHQVERAPQRLFDGGPSADQAVVDEIASLQQGIGNALSGGRGVLREGRPDPRQKTHERCYTAFHGYKSRNRVAHRRRRCPSKRNHGKPASATTSDRNAKESFASVSPKAILEKVASLPIQTWSFKEMPDVPHMRPTAQDFHAAFGLGGSDTTIATVDPDGVALAAIQGLNELIKETDTKIAQLEERLSELENVVRTFSQNAAR
jgi:hypothetical protein